MRTLIFTFILFISFTACQNESTKQTSAKQAPDFVVQTNKLDLQYENLRLLPIVASDAFIAQNAGAADLMTLQEALVQERFRITERKPFGRREDDQAVNTLLVHNKTEAPVFLMAGEVVQGGQQDRVIAQDAVIAARSLTNIPVFCVEPGRWSYHENPETAQPDKKIYAFTGYYHVASPQVRKSAQYEQDQQAVWKHVAAITEANDAKTETGAYAGLEQSQKFTQARDRYITFFKDKVNNSANMIGLVAISGNQIIGADVFAHPTLFRKQYEALLHSYVTHALTSGASVNLKPENIELYINNLAKKYHKNAVPQWNGMVLHWGEL
ncbi:MAG: ARPP-1 family domain-containing protein [Saprospiraceae bacterium]